MDEKQKQAWQRHLREFRQSQIQRMQRFSDLPNERRCLMHELGREYMQAFYITRNPEHRRLAANCYLTAAIGWKNVKFY